MVAAHTVQLGDFQFDTNSGELHSLKGDGRKIRLPEQSFRILQVLLERPGDVVTREELRRRLWTADTFVDFDAGLNNAVKKLRDALEDSSERPRFIETVPRRGYRLIAPANSRQARIRHTMLPVVGAAAILTLGLVLSLTQTRSWLARVGILQPPAIRSIVVLPFQNLSGDPAQQYLVDGIGDALTSDLAQIGRLRVISRTSALHYRGTTKRLTDITRELDVEGAIEGSVSRVGDRVVVRVQLIHGAADRHLWAQIFERQAQDILALQADLALAIARAIHLQILPNEQQRLAKWQAVDRDAYDAYLRGRFEWNRVTPQGTLKGIALFEEAIAKDARYAPAYSGLSDSYRLLDQQGLSRPEQSMPKAAAAARQALKLDDSLGEAHASLAGVLYRYEWQWDAAEREFRRSVDLEPNYAEGRRAYGVFLGAMRRFDESVEQLRRARELNPLSQIFSGSFVAALYRAGRNTEAVAEAERIRGPFPGVTRRLDTESAYVYMRQGRWQEAIAALGTDPPGARPNPWLGYCYAKVGREADARAMLAVLHENAKNQYRPLQTFAIVHLGLGERDEAFAWLEKGYEERALDVATLTIGLFELLRDDPQFRDLLRRMGLTRYKEFN
jgi:TolB-like protein/DNA-binding winged helix-turn-helix (wHTH) protein